MYVCVPYCLHFCMVIRIGVSLKSLNLIKVNGEKFRLINMVSSRWESFGAQLDIHYNQLEAWRQECLGNAARCWNKVMGHWLAEGGTPNYPANWEGLYVLLKDVECSKIAQQLKEVVTAKENISDDSLPS